MAVDHLAHPNQAPPLDSLVRDSIHVACRIGPHKCGNIYRCVTNRRVFGALLNTDAFVPN